MSNVTQILARIEQGEPQATDQLLPLVYEELRKLAAAKLAHEQPGQTLQATALVHEAYLRLVAQPLSPDSCPLSPPAFDSRAHFFAAAAEAMRRILVERARRKRRVKHGGDAPRADLDLAQIAVAGDGSDEQLLALDEALTHLAKEDPQAARVVELRYFAGLGHADVAATLQITVYQARQKWTYARAWLRNAVAER